MTLTEFLLARIAEDERAARQGSALDDPRPNVHGSFDPDRVVAECAAKRHIVDRVTRADADAQSRGAAAVLTTAGALMILAMPYSDHPDFRNEWKL